MKFLSRLFGGEGDEDGHEPPSMPWDRRPSILEFVRSHAPTDGPGVTEGGYVLPDDERVNAGSRLRWGMGSMDGVMTHHMGTGENEETVRKTVDLVLAHSRQPTATNKAGVYQHVIAAHVVSIIDPVIEALLNRFPGRGGRLIEAGLKSPVVRNRNMALNALAAWSREDWPGRLKEALEQAVRCEPKEDVRERMRKALQGEPLSE